MPVKRVGKRALKTRVPCFCSAIVLLCGFDRSPVLSGPLFFFLQDRRRTQDTWGQAVREGGSAPEASGPVGICHPEGDFLGPAQFPALLTSPLDGCPELGGLLQSAL